MDTISSELFFNEAELRVLIPNLSETDTHESLTFESIVDRPARSYAFYDEHVRVYLLAKVPHHIAGTGADVVEAVHTFFEHLDVQVEASIVDSAGNVAGAFPPLQTSSSFSTLHHRSLSQKWAPSISAPSSPQMANAAARGPMSAPVQGDISLPFFSHTYSRDKDPDVIIQDTADAYCCLYPLSLPILYVKTRGNHPQLSVLINVGYRPFQRLRKTHGDEEKKKHDEAEYDVDLFETIDLLGGLSEDPVFGASEVHQRFAIEKHDRQPSASLSSSSSSSSSTFASSMLTLRRPVREMLPVRAGLNVKMRTTNLSVADKMVMMSVELENPAETGCAFDVDKIDVQVSNAVVVRATKEDTPFPMRLHLLDQMVFLYHVTLLEDGQTKPEKPPPRIFPTRRPPPIQEEPPKPQPVHPQRVSIQVVGSPLLDNGERAPEMRSKWNTMLDVMRAKPPPPVDPRFHPPHSVLHHHHHHQRSSSSSVSVSPGARSVGSPAVHQPQQAPRPFAGAPSGLLPTVPKETEVTDGIVVSFTVPETIQAGKIFPLHIFIVNRSKHTRRFMIMVPNRKRQGPAHTTPQVQRPGETKTSLPPLPVEPRPIEPYLEEGEFLRQYYENETREADIICLENNVRLSPLGPSTSQTIDIRFIAVKEQLHTIDLIQLVDQDTGFVTNLRHVLEIFVHQ